MYRLRPVANGTSTHHPVPGLPFIHDGRLPLDNPDAIERTGRNQGEGLWGRTDRTRDGGWVAFTTEPKNPAFAWAVYHHPPHGRTVLLIHDRDQADLHDEWMYSRTGFLHRRGGYWWDGNAWHRPAQVWDAAYESFDPRPVDDATGITAADLLDSTSSPQNASIMKIASFTAQQHPLPNWRDHLALWAQHRESQLPLDRCIVDLHAPELQTEKLIDKAKLAKIATVSVNDLPDPQHSGRDELPEPQREAGGTLWWSVPVAEDWSESYRRNNGPQALLSATTIYDTTQPTGLVADHNRLRGVFHDTLTEQRHRGGKRRAPYMNGEVADDAANALAWDAAASLMYGHDQGLVPHGPLRDVLVAAILGRFAEDLERSYNKGKSQEEIHLSDMSTSAVKLLMWYIQRRPRDAANMFGEICLTARVRLGLPPSTIGSLIRRSLYLDSNLDRETIDSLLDMALPPSASRYRKPS